MLTPEERKERSRIACRKWRAANPGKQAELCRNWEKNNPEKFAALKARTNKRRTETGWSREYAKAWRARTPDSALRLFRSRTGIDFSFESLTEMKEKQENRCAICRNPAKLCIDHCHKTSKVRGLLCHPCNVSLGLMKDSFSNLIRAADYIRRA